MFDAIFDAVVVVVIIVIIIIIVGIDDNAWCPLEDWLFVEHDGLVFGDGVDSIDDVVGNW